MSVKRGSTTFLKVIIFLAGIAVLALYIFSAQNGEFQAELYQNIILMKYFVFIVMYGAALPFTLLSIRLLIFCNILMGTELSRDYL